VILAKQTYYGKEEWISRRLCFHCNYWRKLAALAVDPISVRVNGVHYQIGPANEPFPGFGGRRFKISFHDGRVVETCNLWHQGTIPGEWRSELPDNARMV
jgi:hypothetical protein